MVLHLKAPADSDDGGPGPRIAVVGVGGAGGNAVNNMLAANLEGVDFLAANTDAQALAASRAEHRVQLGITTTGGLGAGSRTEVGRAAAEESIDQIREWVGAYDMVFVAAGLGGGTGTGAAPVVSQVAREQRILTVGVVTLPFTFEGPQRTRIAETGLAELEQFVDTLIVIPNQNLFRVADEGTTFADAFKMADDILYSAVRGVTDLIILPGLVNLDFADVQAVMTISGKAMMGTGQAEGDRRALEAAEAAIANPLLDNASIKGAKGVLINITGGPDLTLFEVDEAANRVRAEVDAESFTIFGSVLDETAEGKMRVSVIATGMASEAATPSLPGGPPAVDRPESQPPVAAAAPPGRAEPRASLTLAPAELLRLSEAPPAGAPPGPAAGTPDPSPAAPDAGARLAGPIVPEGLGEPEAAAPPEPPPAVPGASPAAEAASADADGAADAVDPFLAAARAGLGDGLPERPDGDGGNDFLRRVARLARNKHLLPGGGRS